MIAHPPCTFICNSGVPWLVKDGYRYEKMVEACKFFNALLNAPIPCIAIENPIPHKYALAYIRDYDHMVQPWWFGEGETKATCLWLVNLPPLMATLVHPARVQRLHRLPPSADRGKIRSITYQGIADAMAEQWGKVEE